MTAKLLACSEKVHFKLKRKPIRIAGMAELAKLAGVGKTVVFDMEHGKESVQFEL